MSRDLFAYHNFNQYQQWALVHPEDPTMYKTFFLQKDHIAKKDRIIGETNWTVGEVPPTIRKIHPMHYSKIKRGSSY